MTFPIAYIAAAFPLRSETFVYREVRALRAAGWDVRTVSLHEPAERGVAEFADLEDGTCCVYGPGHRGATVTATVAELLAHPLRALGTVATAFGDALNPGERLSTSGRAKVIGQALAALGVARRLRAAGVRHVHCHFAHAPASVGMYAARQLGVPFSFTGHANDLFQRRALLRRKLERAAFVACISEWHRQFYRDIVPDADGSADARYHVIRCGVDVTAWTPKADAGREIATSDPLRVLTVCRLVEKKGVDTLIAGLDLFGKTTGRAWHLTIGGDGAERVRLKGIAGALGCTGSITWLGSVGNDRVREMLKNTDVFALPCREDRGGDRDGIPVVLIEAMASGVPVIAGDLPAIRELVRHDDTGLVVDARRPEPLQAELARLADTPGLRAKLAAAARSWVETEFSLAENVDRIRSQILAHSTTDRPSYRTSVPAVTVK